MQYIHHRIIDIPDYARNTRSPFFFFLLVNVNVRISFKNPQNVSKVAHKMNCEMVFIGSTIYKSSKTLTVRIFFQKLHIFYVGLTAKFKWKIEASNACFLNVYNLQFSETLYFELLGKVLCDTRKQ